MDKTRSKMTTCEMLESFLSRACAAEAANDHKDAERLFRLALYCEGRLRPDVSSAKDYAAQVGPVYANAASPLSSVSA